jgi:hypothetical protein
VASRRESFIWRFRTLSQPPSLCPCCNPVEKSGPLFNVRGPYDTEFRRFTILLFTLAQVVLAELHTRCSRHAEAEACLAAARLQLEAVVGAHGLVEMLADERQRSLYMPGLLELVKVRRVAGAWAGGQSEAFGLGSRALLTERCGCVSAVCSVR